MDTNNTNTNEGIVEVTEEISRSFNKELKIAAGIGLSVLAGFMAYKYIIRPIKAKIKAKKKQTEERDINEERHEEVYNEYIEEDKE